MNRLTVRLKNWTLLLFVLIAASKSLAQTVWFRGTIEQAAETAAAQNKIVLVLFSCGEG
ncbi:MAG: hypothetical protein ABIL68_00605 [bacterium]